jgi:predicted acetyltransferase
MNVELKKVSIDEKEILRNLLEKYNYEFSQWAKNDVNDLGLYGYQYLDYYWTENKRWAYFVLVDNKLAGFAMIIDLPEVDDRETDFQMAEFFILHKYRQHGIGKQVCFQIFELHKGRWQLKRHPHNIASVLFWDKVIDEYTHGQYELVRAYPNTEYDDGTCGDIYFFNT